MFLYKRLVANPCYARNVWGASFPPPPSTELITFSCESASRLLILSTLTVDLPPPPGSTEAITFPCESESWLLILSTSIVDLPPPRINRGDHFSTQKWKLTVDPLYIDCWSSLHWLLTLSTLIVNPPYIDYWYIDCWPSPHWLLTLSTLTVDPLHIDCWPSLHWLLTLSTLIVDPLYIDCWSSLCWSSICPPPRINRGDRLFHVKVKVDCWSSPHRLSIEPPQDQQCWSPLCWLLILSASTVDRPPLQISTFQSLIYWFTEQKHYHWLSRKLLRNRRSRDRDTKKGVE